MANETRIYFYNPSLAASILFTIIYIIPLLYQSYQTLLLPRKGSRPTYFIPVVIGSALEVVGYAIRCASIRNQESIPLYAVSATVIVIAPVFVCASLYMLLGKIESVTPGGTRTPADFLGRVSVKFLPWVFVVLDLLSVLTQGSGSGIASAGNWEGKEHDTGIAVLIAGLVLQVVTFAAYLVIIGWFHFRTVVTGGHLGRGVGMVLRGVYIAGFFIIVRSVYRVFEFALGIDSYAFTHEWPLYVLEAIPMLVALMVLGWFHPAKWLTADLETDAFPMRKSRRRTARESLV